jgi:hypothetical protein
MQPVDALRRRPEDLPGREQSADRHPASGLRTEADRPEELVCQLIADEAREVDQSVLIAWKGVPRFKEDPPDRHRPQSPHSRDDLS